MCVCKRLSLKLCIQRNIQHMNTQNSFIYICLHKSVCELRTRWSAKRWNRAWRDGNLSPLFDNSLEYSCWCWACPIDSTSIIVIRLVFSQFVFKFFFCWFCGVFFLSLRYLVCWSNCVYMWFVCRTNFIIPNFELCDGTHLKEYVCYVASFVAVIVHFFRSFFAIFSKFL